MKSQGRFYKLRVYLHLHQLLLSILAGTSMESLQQLSGHTKVVRIMPNTPAQLAQGMSVFHAAKEVNSTEKALVKRLLDSVVSFGSTERDYD